MHVTMICNGVVPPPNYGGTERVVNWLVKELAALGHRVTLIAAPGSRVPEAAAVIEFPFAAHDPATHAERIGALIPHDTDIVHDHCCYGEFLLPTLRTIHGLPEKNERLDERFSFVSNAHRYFSRKPGNPFVHNGIDPSEYRYRERKDDFFLFMGKVDWNVKGLDIALEVANRAGINLVIAGDFLDPGYYERELKPRLSRQIRYVGPVGGADKAELLAAARGVIFPTRWAEPFGLVAVEAMASGTPVVTTWNGALPEIMVQGRTGMMCDSITELVDGVRRIDSYDPRECRKRVEENFTASIMAKRYLQLYRRSIDDFGYIPATAEEKQGFWQKRTEDRPWEVDGWLELADALLQLGQVQKAVAVLQDALEALPFNADCMRFLVAILEATGQGAEASRLKTGIENYLQGIRTIIT